MAKIILEYDGRNPSARNTIDYILSLGLFKVANKEELLSKQKFLSNFEKSLVEVDKIKKSGRKELTRKKLLDELS